MIEFNVPAMSCSHCVRTITETVREVDPQATVQVDLGTKSVKVESSAAQQQIVQALSEAGYPPAP